MAPDFVNQPAQEPAESTSDGELAQSHPLPDLIQAEQFVAGKAAVAGTNDQGGKKSAWACLRPARVTPPGTT